MKKIVVTGASGYLGSQISNFLARKHSVYAFVRDTSPLGRLDQSKVTIKSINNEIELDEALRVIKPDIVINTVALYGRKNEPLSALVAANVAYPMNLFELANQYQAKAFIHTGTSLPDDVSAYALTKNTFPKLINYQYGQVQFVNIELEHFYGSYDEETKLISYIIKQCKQNSSIELTAGEQERDFIYIEDVLSAYELIINNLDKLSRYESIPLGSGEVIKIKSLIGLIHNLTKSKTQLNFGAIPMRKNELMHACADISKLKRLGWQPQYSLLEGLALTISEGQK